MLPTTPSPARTRLLVVVAHPDDETFGCGSLLAHAARRGVEVHVCCATRGEAGESPPGVDLAAVREAELRAAADLLGVARVHLLGFADSGMAGVPAPGTLCAADPAEVAAQVSSVLADVRPDVVVTMDASDGHRDHVTIRDATLAAVAAADVPPTRAYLTCLPRSLMRRWVEHLRTSRPGSEHLDLDPEAMGTPDEVITTVVDTADLEELRWQAIRLHASQASPYDDLPADLASAFLGAERLQRVVPPWDGGEPERDLFAGV